MKYDPEDGTPQTLGAAGALIVRLAENGVGDARLVNRIFQAIADAGNESEDFARALKSIRDRTPRAQVSP